MRRTTWLSWLCVACCMVSLGVLCNATATATATDTDTPTATDTATATTRAASFQVHTCYEGDAIVKHRVLQACAEAPAVPESVCHQMSEHTLSLVRERADTEWCWRVEWMTHDGLHFGYNVSNRRNVHRQSHTHTYVRHCPCQITEGATVTLSAHLEYVYVMHCIIGATDDVASITQVCAERMASLAEHYTAPFVAGYETQQHKAKLSECAYHAALNTHCRCTA